MSQIELEQIKIPRLKQVQFKLEITGDVNITSFSARQKVNRYLLAKTGNLIHSMEPDLIVGDALVWKVPIGFSLPDKGFLGRVGDILVDANTGNLLLEQSTLIVEIEENAERLYSKTTS